MNRGLSRYHLNEYGTKLSAFAKIAGAVLLFAVAALVAQPAQAQTLTYSVETSTSNGASVTPRVTWTTAPAGATCTATSVPAEAKWTGSQLSSGTVLLPAITATNSYGITCTWAGKPTFGVTWGAPTTNTDGSPLTDLAGFRVLYGRTAADLDQSVYLQDPAARSWTSPTGLAVGNWYAGVRAFNAMGLESATTPAPLPKTISVAATQTRNSEIAIKFPGAPTNVN